ncbi:MAG: hypothetical protein A2096_14925 [Spirochaetes bacterium GWF1_41_5]|nr:MAG: hypothetical protein A2096_14925 [Spirochaetes bacterium GWF1_41_5]
MSTPVYSKYNIICRLPSGNHGIINLLSGQADLLDRETGDSIIAGKMIRQQEMMQKGYAVNPETESIDFKNAYLAFLDKREQDEIQIFYAPWYSCNLRCKYCYQDEYGNSGAIPGPGTLDAFFSHIEKYFSGRRKYLTLFGGEPLLPGREHRRHILDFFERSIKNGLETAMVSNGYHIKDYIDEMKTLRLREVQLTLDGTEKIHNQRRPCLGGGSSYYQVLEAVDLLLSKNIPVNLRFVADQENISELPALSELALKKGWTKSAIFKTQIGRNYELHHCSRSRQILFDRFSLYEKIFSLLQEFPVISEFHRPAFSVTRFLADSGELPDPLFDSCPGTKTEWAFDGNGDIYSCTASVGKKEEKLGSFYPDLILDNDKIRNWQKRDIMSIPGCRECNVNLACGGGCAMVAKNKTGSLHSPDCRPVKELCSLGMEYYFKTNLP